MKPPASLPGAIGRSGIREVMELAATMTDVIHLEVGDPDLSTPAPIVEAAHRAALEGYTHYAPNAGLPGLRAAIADWRRERYGLETPPEGVVVTPGAVCALASSVLALVDPGEEVLVPDPGWPNYVSMVRLAGARPVAYPLRPEAGYLPDPADLEPLVTPRTKLLLVNTPANPSGAVFPEAVVRDLVGWAADHDLYVLSDEVYEAFVFRGRHVPARCFDPDGRVVTVAGFSKTYAMTGWRLGYAVAPPEIAELITRLQEPLVSCAATPTQKAAEAALRLPEAVVEEMRERYRRRAELVAEVLEPAGLLPVRPAGAFYAFLDLRRLGDDSHRLARRLLERERVATAPGETFGAGGRGRLRISLTADETSLLEGCRRILRFAAEHPD
ncbi:MAG TPA: aminotransferase class I/II-fold pyridoxal phosphate-dependent enzyme [Candidatus Dormibacteraeota bacterium]|jgi:aspartate/methionine/tyrosine aminotransferase|nr:aminotransferase class I/II-fold pyridoxal phosphate-dependent enzyme [Candidatus Dormibacteraeota bacterium]